jgi:fluoride exporter
MPGPALRAPVAYAAIGLGSALGGVARWLLSEALQVDPGVVFPWGTLLANTSGSLLIGFYAAWSGGAGRRWGGLAWRLFFMTGFCGGFTTFSIFSLETVLFVQARLPLQAGAYVVASLVLWIGGAWAGYRLGLQARWGAAR